MPSIKYSIDSSGAERGAQRFSSAIDRVVSDARRSVQALEQLDRAMRTMGQTASGISSSVSRIAQAGQQIQRATRPAAAEVNALSASMRNMSSAAALSFGPLSGLGARFMAVESLATRNSLALGGMISAATGVGVAFAESVRRAADFEQAMLRVAKVTNATTSELRVQSADVLKLSSSLGIPAGELAKIEESAARLGIRGSANLATFAAEIAKLTRTTTDMDAKGLSTQLAQFLNLTKLAPADITKVSSAITALGNNFATSEGKIISMALELARGSSAFDIGSDKLLALSASLAAVGERSERSGTALTQVLIGITQAAAGGKHLEDFAKLLGVTKEKFQELAKQDVGQVFIEVLKRLQAEGPGAINVLQELQLGSSRNFKVLLTQAQAIDEVGRALGIVRGQYASATATDQEFSRMNEALNRQLETAGVQLENLGIALGATLIPALTSALVAVNDFLRSLQGIEAPADSVGTKMQNIANDVVLAVHAFQALMPLLSLTGSLMQGLVTFDFTTLASTIASIPQRFAEVSAATVTLSQDFARMQAGKPLRLFEGAAKDAEDARAVSSAVGVMTNSLQNATRAPDALTAAMSTLGKSTKDTTGAFDKNREAIDKALAGMDRDIAAKKALATQGEAAAEAQKVLNDLAKQGVQVSDADRAAILARAKALTGYEQSAKSAGTASKDAAEAAKKLDEGLAGVIRELEKELKLQGLDESQKAVVELTAKVEDLRAKAVEGGADEAAAREKANRTLADAIPLQEELNARKAEEARQGVTADLQEQLALRQTELQYGKAAAETQRILNDLRSQGIDVTDEYAASVRRQVEALQALERQSTAISDAFEDFIAGIAAGTQELSLDGISDAFKAAFAASVKEKLQFDEIFKGNMLDLVGFTGDLFSSGGIDVGGLFSFGSGGGASAGAGVSGGGFGDWFNLLTNGPGGGGTGNWLRSLVNYRIGADYDTIPTEDFVGPPTESGHQGTTGQGGSSIGDIGGGALIGFGTSSTLGGYIFRRGSTGLTGLAAQGAEGGINRNATIINDVIGTALGALFSAMLGSQLGGLIGGAISSAVGAAVVGSITRDTVLKGEFTGGIGKFAQTFEGPLGFGPQIIYSLLGIPTLGTAFRRAGEGILDKSQVFGNEGLQGRLGDFQRSGAANQRGPEIALERGMTQAQVDAIMGGTGSLFSQLAKGELPQDAGRFAEAMGRTMAEFLSRGLADGMDYDEMLDSLRQFAHEGGMDALSSVKNLTAQLEQSKAAATDWGKLDPLAASQQSFDAYAQSLYGITQVFKGDFPAGVNLASLALQTMERDGVKAFDGLDVTGKETLQNLTEDAESFQAVVAKLAEQGFTIDTEEFETRLKAITQSAEFLGQSLGQVFDFNDVGAGVTAVFQQLKGQIFDTFKQTSLKQLFDTTGIASSFEPVFAALDRIDEFDLTTATGSQGFTDILLPALAEGKANLQDYIPILKVMAENWKEIQKAIDEAMEPTTFERAAAAVEGAFSGLGGILDESLSAGLAVLADGGTYDEALGVFKSTFADGAEDALKRAAFNAMVDAAILAPLIQKWQPAFAWVVSTGMSVGFKDPKVQAAWDLVMAQFAADAGSAAPFVFDAYLKLDGSADAEMDRFFSRLKDDVASINQELGSGLTSLVRESVDIGLEKGAEAGRQHFQDGLGDVIYEVTLNALIKAFVDAAIVDNLLGPAIEQGAALWAAATSPDGPGGRLITPDEQAGLDEWKTYFKGVADVAREQWGQMADFLFGPSGVLDLPGAPGRGTSSPEERRRLITRNGDIEYEDTNPIPPATAGIVREGFDNLNEALDADSIAAIGDGVDALSDAIDTEQATAIKDGLGNLKDALGTDQAVAIEGGLGALGAALNPEQLAQIAAGLGSLTSALGAEAATGLAASVQQATAALGPGPGLAGVAGQLSSDLQSALGEAGASGAATKAAEGFTNAIPVIGTGADGIADALGKAATAAVAFATRAAAAAEELGGDTTGGSGGINLDLDRDFQFRANGGPVAAGAVAVVGEEGPEIMVAHGGGGATIIPLKAIPGLANGGTIGASGAGVTPLPWAGISSAADTVTGALAEMATAVSAANEAARAAASGLDSVATASSSTADTAASLIGAPHTRGRPPLGGPDEPSYTPITTDQLEPEDFARIDETWKGMTGLFDNLFSSKDFVEKILNNKDLGANDYVMNLIRQMNLTAGDGLPGEQDPFTNGSNNPEALNYSFLSPKATVNDIRWYAQLLEEVGAKDFTDYLHARRVNAELFQESTEQVVPGGGALPPVDYLEYSDKIDAFFAKYGGDANRSDIGPMSFLTRAPGTLTQWLDPEKIQTSITLSLDAAVKDFAQGGSIEDMRTAINESVNQSMYDGLVQGMISALALEDQQAILSAAVTDAMSDGFLDASDVESLRALAGSVATDLADSVEGMGPAFRAIAEAFGIDLGDAVNGIDLDPKSLADALGALGGEISIVDEDGVAQDLRNALMKAAQEAAPGVAQMVGGALQGLLSDPTKLNIEAFSANLRDQIYQNVAGGLIDAFIQSAVVQGALAPMLGAIQLIFDQIGKKQLGIAEANNLIVEQIGLILDVLNDPAFQSAINTLLAGVAKIGEMLGAFPDAANDVAAAAGNVSDAVTQAQDDACAGKCDLKESTVKLGETVLDASGRVGAVEDIVYKMIDSSTPSSGTTASSDPVTGHGVYGAGPYYPGDGRPNPWAGTDTSLPPTRTGGGPGEADGDGTWSHSGTWSQPQAGAASFAGDTGSDDDLLELVAEMRDEIRTLHEDLAGQPIVVNGEVKVGEHKFLELLWAAKRTGRASGNDVFGSR